MNLFPQDTSYANAFNKMADILQETVTVIATADRDFTKLAEYRARSSKLETEADIITRSILQKINTSSATPYNRNDIADLTEGVDDIIDHIDHLIHDIDIYGIHKNRDYLGVFVPLYLQGASDTKKALNRLFEQTPTNDSVLSPILALRSIGSHGETAYEANLRDLFTTCKNPILVIKWKAIIESMRSVTRAYKTLANIIENILTKNEELR